jgi:hypothetical protein
MKQQLVRAFGSKVVVGLGATVLAFGTAGTVIALQPASDTAADHGGTLVAAEETTTTTSTSTSTSTTVAPTTTTTSTTVAPTTTTTTVHDADDDHGTEADEHEHPDNFGATVSEDARDGGVDGREISQAAHDRNDDRRAAAGHDADDDHKAAADHADDDHGGQGHGGQGRDHAED